MTNAKIIGNAQDALLKAGMIKATGRVLRAIDGAGNEILVHEAEPIHTYQTWKELGLMVIFVIFSTPDSYFFIKNQACCSETNRKEKTLKS